MYYAIEQFRDYGKESYEHLIISWKGTPNLDADSILKEYYCMTRKVFGEDLYLTSLIPSFPMLIEMKLPLRKRFSTPAGAGTYVISAVESDLPDIGKNLFSIMLQGAGFRVIDLGTTSPPSSLWMRSRNTIRRLSVIRRC